MDTSSSGRPGPSRLLAGYVAVLGIVGLIAGSFVGFGDHPPARPHVPAENAWPAHLVIGCVLGVVLAALIWRRRDRLGGWLLTPVSADTAGRVRVLLSAARRGRPGALVRLAVGLPPFALITWCIFRAAFQITMGFDPNQVVNAWGGPTYLGAMLCHYLDATVLTLPALYLLHLLLPRVETRAETTVQRSTRLSSRVHR